MKKDIAALFDLDGTLTTVRVWRGIMDYFQDRAERRWTHRGFMAYHLPLYAVHRAGLMSETGFRSRWAGHLAWYLKGLTVQQGEEVWDWVVDTFLAQFWRPESRDLVKRHLDRDDVVVLVSSSPTPLVQRAAISLGAEHAVGTQFEVENDVYTGGVRGPVCINETKRILVEAYFAAKGMDVDLPGSYSYADSISDLPVLEMVGHPVATFAEEDLSKVARHRGWSFYPPD